MDSPYRSRSASYADSDSVSSRLYNAVIGIVLLYGFVVTGLVEHHFHDLKPSGMVMVGYFASVILGCILGRFESTFVKFVGYNLIVLPIGVILGPMLAKFHGVQITNALMLTGGATCLMMAVATFFPRACLSIGNFLFWALMGLVLSEIGVVIVFGVFPKFFDFVSGLIFSGFIAYDWAVAQNQEKTFANAINSSCELYLDAVNLFISILGASSDDD